MLVCLQATLLVNLLCDSSKVVDSLGPALGLCHDQTSTVFSSKNNFFFFSSEASVLALQMATFLLAGIYIYIYSKYISNSFLM